VAYVDGDLTEMISPQGTIQYGYEGNARLDELTEVIPGGSNKNLQKNASK